MKVFECPNCGVRETSNAEEIYHNDCGDDGFSYKMKPLLTRESEAESNE